MSQESDTLKKLVSSFIACKQYNIIFFKHETLNRIILQQTIQVQEKFPQR
ncbi:Uncharacterized protein dnl_17140 [Desulfonema limicola]|uniref:Uncharacterized protein n=1 Tax=Desulfonema limicola TaxID=45656 RepID=A0A975B627_9BACT|nr:Uncharacterized protein dnl_17140 [Desulfonema limicola]